MPKLRASDWDFDEGELEGAEYNEDGDREFEDYDGEDPPVGTILSGFIKKVWLTKAGSGADMLKVLFIAADNTGKREEFNGWPGWDNLALQANTKFKWKPFLDATGLTLRDLRTKTVTSDEDSNLGDEITKIGEWHPGEDSDSAWVRVLIKKETYQGVTSSKVGKFLPYEDAEEDEDEEEEEATPPKPARGGRAAASTAKTSARRKAAEPEPEDEEEEELDEEELEDESEEEEAPPARPSRSRSASKPAASRASRGRTTASKPAAKPATRARGRAAKPVDDEPPF